MWPSALSNRHLPLLLLPVLLLARHTSSSSVETTTFTASAPAPATDKTPTAELPHPLRNGRQLIDSAIAVDEEEFGSPPGADNNWRRAKHARHRQAFIGGTSARPTLMDIALEASAREGLQAMAEVYGRLEHDIVKNGRFLQANHPATLLSQFSAPADGDAHSEMAAYATITATKAFRRNFKHYNDLARHSHSQKISLRRTALEGLCPPRDAPICMPASERYRTHDGTCNNKRHPRWGSAQMPFNRFLPPEYGDGVDSVRESNEGGALSSSRFVSLLVHGAKDGDAPITLMTVQWGQLLDHDLTSTAQPRAINGSVPSCCGRQDFHPSCFPIKVPLDDPWLAPLKVRCLEFLRSAPAQRRDCVLSWREQTNQATSYIDASPIYANSAKASDNARIFRGGLLIFGRGNAADDVCQRGAIATHCIRAGDGRSGEQPGLLALHHVWVGEHNRIAQELGEMNPHWSDEKLYQETRRIVGAMFQHITYREFLPVILGREVCKLFDLELLNAGYYPGHNPKVNPTVANSFAAAAFRFGHSLVQNSYLRCDRHHNVLGNNVSLHEEFQRGDIGSAGSLHRLLRGLATQRALKRDEFITPELTNHLFQTPGFPFGLDLAAINIQRGRDHGIAPYTTWRVPCGLSAIGNWEDLANVVGPESAQRIAHAYRSVHDIDLFVGGIAERPVMGGLVGPTFACIIAQQFSNSRKGDRFWYENGGLDNSFTPAQLHSLRRVTLAQVLCRSVGGGTFQPHIFIPAEQPSNERQPCGTGSLTPIDLGPWLEQDPFTAPQRQPAGFGESEALGPEQVFDIMQPVVPVQEDDVHGGGGGVFVSSTTIAPLLHKENQPGFPQRNNPPPPSLPPLPSVAPHISFIPNSASGFQKRPQHFASSTASPAKVSDKLDLKRKASTATKRPGRPGATTTLKPISGINNKLDKNNRFKLKTASVHRNRHGTTTRRTVVINNLPLELRTAAGADNVNGTTTANNTTPATSTTTPTPDKTRTSTNKKKKKQQKNKKKHAAAAQVKSSNDDVAVDRPEARTQNDDDADIDHEDEATTITTTTITDNDIEGDEQTAEQSEEEENGTTTIATIATPTTTMKVKLMTERNATSHNGHMTRNTTERPPETTQRRTADTAHKPETDSSNEGVTEMALDPLTAKMDQMNGTIISDKLDLEEDTQTNATTPNVDSSAETKQLDPLTHASQQEHKRVQRQYQHTRTIEQFKTNNGDDDDVGETHDFDGALHGTMRQTKDTKTATNASDQRQDRLAPTPPPPTTTTTGTHKSSKTSTRPLTRLSRPSSVAAAMAALKLCITSNTTSKFLTKTDSNNYAKSAVTPTASPAYVAEQTTTFKVPKQPKTTTRRGVELRQYQTRPIYTRPPSSPSQAHKVIVDGPNSDQYEIEINIRQTNKSPPQAAYRPLTTTYATQQNGYDNYQTPGSAGNYIDYGSTTPARPYYQQTPPTTSAPSFGAHNRRTKPPTIIYLNEHDDRGTTTRAPNLFQNFITFATNGFTASNRPHPQHGHSLSSSILSPVSGASPHSSSVTATQYRPPAQSQSTGGGVTSFSQVSGYPAVAHASTGAVSAGSYGSIVGVASSNGADSTFSFNIRPRPERPVHVLPPPTGLEPHGTYGLYQPPRNPQPTTYDYGNVPSPIFSTTPNSHGPYQNELPHRPDQTANSPFSITVGGRPQTNGYYGRTKSASPPEDSQSPPNPDEQLAPSIDRIVADLTAANEPADYDYQSRTLEVPSTDSRHENANPNVDRMDDDFEDDDDEDEDYYGDDDHADKTDDGQTIGDSIGVDQRITQAKRYNKDGYLRPQHMLEHLLTAGRTAGRRQNDSYANATATLDDNYVLPVLTNDTGFEFHLTLPLEPTLDETDAAQQSVTDYPDAFAKHLNNDILAEDYTDDTTEPFLTSKTAALAGVADNGDTKEAKEADSAEGHIGKIAFAPLQVLTKPERPDNWVIYDTPQDDGTPLLPAQPAVSGDTQKHTAEIPMPLHSSLNSWLTKYTNRVRLPMQRQIANSSDDTTPSPEESITQDFQPLPERR